MITTKKAFRYGTVSILIAIILGYGIWQSRDILFGIKASVYGVNDGLSVSDPILHFGGNAYHANSVVVDGKTVPLTDAGAWEDTLALLPGYNTIQIVVTDRFRRTVTKEYRIYYKNN